MRIKEKQTLLMIGDSVTDCGRVYPYGEGNENLGDGYVRNVHAFIDGRYPNRHIRVLNTGISGNTSRDLVERWQEDVLDLSPDWVSVMIGINDIWRQFDRPLAPEGHIDLKEYGRNLEWMVEKTLPYVRGMCLISPCYLELSREDPMRVQADRYREKAREIAGKYDLVFADAQKEIDAYLEHYHPAAMSWDRVHPNHVGHMLIAGSFLKAVGYQWD